MLRSAAPVLLLAACEGAPCAVGYLRSAGNECVPAFDGVETVGWDGADGLTATWTATGEDSTYTVDVALLDGTPVASAQTTDTTLTVGGLSDGEYLVTVHTRGRGADTVGNDVVIEQCVGAERLRERSELAWTGGAKAIAGVGNLAVLGGGRPDEGGFLVVDITDVDAPEVLAEVTGLGQVTDIEIAGDRVAVATQVDDGSDSPSVRIYDLGDPADPVLLGTIGSGDDSAHTLAFGGPEVIVLASTLNGWEAFWSLEDPAEPERLSTFVPPPPTSVHDQAWIADVLYVAHSSGVAVLDVADPGDPTLAGVWTADWAGARVHNAYPTPDGALLALTEETVGGPLRLLDVSDLGAIALLYEYQLSEEGSVHQVVVRGRYVFATWYFDGILAFDVADPAAVEILGQVDTYAAESGPVEKDGVVIPSTEGAWDVYPFGDHVAVADASRGLILFDFYPRVLGRDGTWDP